MRACAGVSYAMKTWKSSKLAARRRREEKHGRSNPELQIALDLFVFFFERKQDHSAVSSGASQCLSTPAIHTHYGKGAFALRTLQAATGTASDELDGASLNEIAG